MSLPDRPETTVDPIWVAPLNTPNVTVPAFTVPPALVTVAESVTDWLDALNGAVALAAVVVDPALTDNVCVLSLLVLRFVVPLYTAWIVYVPGEVPPGSV